MGGILLKIQTIGFPKMYAQGEKRDFLPELFGKLNEFSHINIYIERDYGKGMGLCHQDYLNENSNLKFVSHYEAYEQDLVVVLKAPEEAAINQMKEGSALISMLHYDTRPKRNQLLKSKRLVCYSMDSMVDDRENRMVVNFWRTAMSGARAAFNKLKKTMKDFYSTERKPINVSIIGFGNLGISAVRAFSKLSYEEFKDIKAAGILVKILSRSITRDFEALKSILTKTDILVDASRRGDSCKVIVPNELIAYMPDHSIILDLTADPYDHRVKPICQKGIEGIPTGNLNHYIIEKDDKLYESIPREVDKRNRRVVVSCNAWPGVYPVESMKVYGNQIYPFISVLLEKGPSLLSMDSHNSYERALLRSSLDFYFKGISHMKVH